MCIISNGLFMSHIIPHSSLNNAWAGRMHRIGLMTWLFPGQSTLSAVHVVLHFARRVPSEASNTGTYFWVTLSCDELFFWASDQCRGTSSLAWPAFDGQSRGHQYWIYVYDLYLTHSWKSIIWGVYLSICWHFPVFFSGVYFVHLLKLYFVAIHLRLCAYIQYTPMCCILVTFLKTFTPQRQELTLNSTK